jgi:hypothetical protein
MALPVTIPNEFANATASIPLSQLDTNFNTLANAVNGISDGSETLANVTATVVNATTIDTTNIEVTNIKAKDGTAAVVLTDSTGAVAVSTPLTANGGVVFNDAGADVDFRVEGDTEANLLFVDASADAVGIGTSSPAGRLTVSKAVSGATSNATEHLSIFNPQTPSAGNQATIGFHINNSNWGTTATFARITAVSENGTTGATALAFGTNTDGASDAPERMRIDSSGNVLVGRTSTIAGARMAVEGSVSDMLVRFANTSSVTPSGLDVQYSNAAPNDSGNWFFLARDTSANRFYVLSNGGIANYSGNNSNLSDRREKTNFAPAKNYLETICSIPVQTFNYIDQNLEEDDGLTLGVVAQDVQAVAPELVMESNWGTKEEPKMRLSIYQTDLQYALMKSIQELKAELDAAKERIAALEANNGG